MTAPARKLLAEFEALDPTDRQEVAVEILRRSASTGDLDDQAHDELAVEIFQAYDAEESASAQRQAR